MAHKKGPGIPRDHYARLQVDPRAGDEVIDAAYRALMKLHHPDKGGDGEAARALNDAHATLSDTARRADYDRGREAREGTLLGPYRVLAPIAEGGFGKTYKAEHTLADEPVCIKHCTRISPEDDALLIQEAKAMWDLRHFAIPAIRDLIRLEDGSLALVMSYIPGQTLAQIVEKIGRLEPEHVAWIAQRVLNALMYIHSHGVVHGDLKPQNVIVQSESHQVVLVDFGLSAVKPSRHSTSKGFTPHFAPPEAERGDPLLPESDFYSLGMTMIYALSGDPEALKRKQVPEEVPEPLCDFIKRLIVRDVLARPRWETVNLFDEIQEVRRRSFGRGHSEMKPIPGV